MTLQRQALAPVVMAPKKLIEIALPLAATHAACAREKSIRQGRPGTLQVR